MYLVYVDDVIVFSDIFEQHLYHKEDVLPFIRNAGLALNIARYLFLQTSVDFLGHVVDVKKTQSRTEIYCGNTKDSVPHDSDRATKLFRNVQCLVPLCSLAQRYCRTPQPIVYQKHGISASSRIKEMQRTFDILRRHLLVHLLCNFQTSVNGCPYRPMPPCTTLVAHSCKQGTTTSDLLLVLVTHADACRVEL